MLTVLFVFNTDSLADEIPALAVTLSLSTCFLCKEKVQSGTDILDSNTSA